MSEAQRRRRRRLLLLRKRNVTEAVIADAKLHDYQIPLNSDEGFHVEFTRLPDEHPFAKATDYERYLERLAAWPRVVDEHIANMRSGLERGFTLPRVVLPTHPACSARLDGASRS